MKKILVCLLALVVLCCSAAMADHLHEFVKTDEVIAATCTTKEMSVWACACGEAITRDEADALGHKYGEATISFVEAIGQNVSTAVCVQCGDVKTEVIEIAPEFSCEHKNIETVVIENIDTIPTCTQDGTAHLRCVDCGKVVGSKVVAKLGHEYDEGVVVVEPTCTGAGSVKFTCTKADCDKLGAYICYEAIDALGHDFSGEAVVDIEPDCLHQGSKQVKCLYCDVWDIQTIPELNHNNWKGAASEVTKEATCTTAGVKTLTCPVGCGATKTEAIPALGHDIVKDFYAGDALAPSWQAPGCGNEGYFYRECSRGCGFHYVFDFTRVPATGDHKVDPDKTEIVIEATCATEGVKKQYCACGLDMGTVLYKLPHTVEEEVIEEAKCYAAGKMLVKCTECTYEAIVVIPATGEHVYGTEKVAPTCLEHGYIVTKCTNKGCPVVVTKIVDPENAEALGHKWYTTKVDQPVSCTTGAIAHQICLVCKNEEDVELPAAGHTSDETPVIIEATCTTPAGYAEHCVVCGLPMNIVALDGSTALGHDFGNQAVVPATCTKAGSTNECVRCGYVVTRPAAGHKYVSSVHDNNCGGTYTRYTCKVCGKKYSVAGTDSYVTARYTTESNWDDVELVAIEDTDYLCFEVDDVVVLIPTVAFEEEGVVGSAQELVLEVVKVNGKTSLKCSVVKNGVESDVYQQLIDLGMIVE